MQYGNPYGYGYGDPLPNLLAPARRAMWLMIILGVVVLLFGGCFTGLGSMWDQIIAQAPPESRAQLEQLQARSGGVSVRHIMLGFGIGLIVLALLHIVVGVIVGRGTMGAAITGLLLTGLMLIGALIMAGGNLMTGNIVGVCMGVVCLALWILLLVWLIQAVSRAGQVAAARAGQYQGQYWQTQPQQPPGYGYPQAPQPPPPPPQ
jgi:hypothetical protein